MASAAEAHVATFVAVVVTASLPFYLYGAWIILRSDVVTWSILIRHLKFIVAGLLLTTIPVVGWMIPRLFERVDGLAALHAILGVQAYALLVFGLTGIVRIIQLKRAHNLYREPDPNVALADLHEDIGAWRRRLRIGVFGYLALWILAWIVGMVRFLLVYRPL